MTYKLVIPPLVASTITHLPPNLKNKIRAALEEIQSDPHLGKPLKDELKNLWSYRVSTYRIVYRIHARQIEIQIIDFGPRNMIYQHVLELTRRSEK